MGKDLSILNKAEEILFPFMSWIEGSVHGVSRAGVVKTSKVLMSHWLELELKTWSRPMLTNVTSTIYPDSLG